MSLTSDLIKDICILKKKKRMPLKKLVKQSEIWTNADETKPSLPLEIKITAELYINPMKLPDKSHLEGEKQGTVRLHDLIWKSTQEAAWLGSDPVHLAPLQTLPKNPWQGAYERKYATERPRHTEKGISRA